MLYSPTMTKGAEGDQPGLPQDVFKEPLRRFGADSAELDKLGAAAEAFARLEWALVRRSSARKRD
jgi:hypothetical protein